MLDIFQRLLDKMSYILRYVFDGNFLTADIVRGIESGGEWHTKEANDALWNIFKKVKSDENSQMCFLWSIKNPPDVLEGTNQLEAIESEFDIEITEEEAVEIYDMNLREASQYIHKLISSQKTSNST